MQHNGLKQEAYAYIYDLLLSNEIKPGDRIREDLIAQEIGMSRTPVREAVNRLIAEGFVHCVPRKGLFAAKVSVEDLLKMLDVRIALEALAVESCCRHITDAELKKLEGIYDAYSAKMMAGEIIEASSCDREFHICIASASKNMKLQQYIADLVDFYMYAKFQAVKMYTGKSMQRVMNNHKNILEAIRERNVRKAKKMIETDIGELKNLLDKPVCLTD